MQPASHRGSHTRPESAQTRHTTCEHRSCTAKVAYTSELGVAVAIKRMQCLQKERTRVTRRKQQRPGVATNDNFFFFTTMAHIDNDVQVHLKNDVVLTNTYKGVLGLHCFLRLERALCWRSGRCLAGVAFSV